MNWEQIYKRYYSNYPETIVKKLWLEVAQYLEIPYGKLRPSDRFDKELSPVKGWEYDDPFYILTIIAEERLKKAKDRISITDIKTLDDYIKIFSKIETE